MANFATYTQVVVIDESGHEVTKMTPFGGTFKHDGKEFYLRTKTELPLYEVFELVPAGD